LTDPQPTWKHFKDPPTPEGLNGTQLNNEVSRTNTFVREICQNSNDAYILSSSESEKFGRVAPVRMEFDLFDLPVSDFPDLDNFRDNVDLCFEESLAFANNKGPGKVFQKMKDILDSGTVRVMRVRDFNTKGLEGFGTRNQLSSWNRLTVNSAIGDKPVDNAGSKGVGKKSFYEMSYLRTLFFQTRNLDSGEAFVGRCSFQPFHRGDDLYNQIGFYAFDDKGYEPLLDRTRFPVFATDRSESGTDIFIMGYNEEMSDWKLPIVTTIVKSFFVAIIKGYFIARVGDVTIDRDTLGSVIEKAISKTSQYEIEDRELDSLPEVIRAFTDGKVFEHDGFDIYLVKSESKGRIITTKESTGMTIDPFYSQNRNCSGIIMAKGGFARRISDCENPTHTKWNPSNAEDYETRKWAKRALLSLQGSLGNAIKNIISQSLGESLDAAGLGKILSAEEGPSKGGSPQPDIFGKITLSDSTKVRASGPRPRGRDEQTENGSREPIDDDAEYPHTDRHRKIRTDSRKRRDDSGRPTVFNTANGHLSNVRIVLESSGSYVLIVDSKRPGKVSIALNLVYENGITGPHLPVEKACYFDGTPIPCSDNDIVGPFQVYDYVRNKIRIWTSYPAHCSVALEVIK
jgi:hypothetical protein